MIELSAHITHDAKGFLIMMICGMQIWLLYGIFCRFLIGTIKYPWLRGLWEIGFWTMAGVFTSQCLFVASEGKLTIYAVGAFIFGILLWNTIKCGILNPNRHE